MRQNQQTAQKKRSGLQINMFRVTLMSIALVIIMTGLFFYFSASIWPVTSAKKLISTKNETPTPHVTIAHGEMITGRVTFPQTAWTKQAVTVFKEPGSDQAIAHLGEHFSVTLVQDAQKNTSEIWYQVQWAVSKTVYDGWLPDSALTLSASEQAPLATAQIDALSPELAAYLSQFGADAGVVVYDLTSQKYYSYQSQEKFLVASSVKVPIMLTFLDLLEQQGRDPTADEEYLLTTMIENSNNDSAQVLYEMIDGPNGINSYMQKIGVSGLEPDADAWGYSLITPQAMVDLLLLLQKDKILNEEHRALALSLMRHIEADQQTGVGDTAPGGASVAMKDGWVPGPDYLWAVNSSGIVTKDQKTYIIAVYTGEQATLADGQAIVRRVCSTVASLLL
jgi:beta-lactamase class A